MATGAGAAGETGSGGRAQAVSARTANSRIILFMILFIWKASPAAPEGSEEQKRQAGLVSAGRTVRQAHPEVSSCAGLTCFNKHDGTTVQLCILARNG